MYMIIYYINITLLYVKTKCVPDNSGKIYKRHKNWRAEDKSISICRQYD